MRVCVCVGGGVIADESSGSINNDSLAYVTLSPMIPLQKAMVMKLPASQRLHFMYPLGGIDVDKFVACVLPFATSSGVLVDAAHAIVGGGDDAELSSEAAEALVSAWEACPELVREIMPATSLLAHTCQNNMMGREVQTILDGLSLERDWKISGYVHPTHDIILSKLKHLSSPMLLCIVHLVCTRYL